MNVKSCFEQEMSANVAGATAYTNGKRIIEVAAVRAGRFTLSEAHVNANLVGKRAIVRLSADRSDCPIRDKDRKRGDIVGH